MAKIKAARGRKKKDKSALQAIPCVILIISGIALLAMLFYALLQSSTQ